MRPLLAAVTPFALIALPHTSTTEPAESAESAMTPFAELLAMAPADSVAAAQTMLLYVDMDLVWERLGVGDDAAERAESTAGLVAPDTWSLIPRVFEPLNDVEGATAEVGFSGFDIHRELAVLKPPSALIIDDTAASADAVVTAMESNPTWSGRLEEVASDHGPYFSWGDGREIDPERRSSFRRLGQAGQFAILGSDAVTTIRTIEADGMEATLATVSGETESAAETGPFAAADDLFADGSVIQAAAVPGPTAFRPPLDVTAEQLEALLETTVFLLPYQGLMVVETTDGDDVWSEVLIFNVNDAAAAKNAELVESAIETGIDTSTGSPLADSFPDATIDTDGAVVRVRVEGLGHFRVFFDMLFQSALFPS